MRQSTSMIAIALLSVGMLVEAVAATPQDMQAHWEALAARGDSAAALQLGLLYDTGKTVPQSFPDAERWYRQAADEGSSVAAFNLAALYDSGRNGVRNPAEALHWYQIAAGRGVGRASYLAGLMLETGDGVASAPAAAAQFYRRAISQGFMPAQRRLASLEPTRPAPPVASTSDGKVKFAAAITVLRDRGLDGATPEALASLRAAADNGYPLAEYDLAYAYEHGLGLNSSPVEAYKWYRRTELSDGPAVLKAKASVNRQRLARTLDDAERQSADTPSAR